VTDRLRLYWQVWRARGAASVDHRLWAYWALFGKYPASADTRPQGGDAKQAPFTSGATAESRDAQTPSGGM
jgi:hypothetical protein